MRIALVGPDALSMWLFRKGLIKQLIAYGHDVYLICAKDDYVGRLEDLGAACIDIQFERFISPIKDIRAMLRLYREFHRQHFDIVQNFTVKPNVYGTITARLSGIPTVVCLVEGLGYLFSDKSRYGIRLAASVLSFLYFIAFGLSDRVCFANPEDRERLVSNGIVKKDKAVVIRSAGINLEEFSAEAVNASLLTSLKNELNLKNESQLVLMVSRLVWSKGIAEFYEAAKILHPRFPSTKFVLVGHFEDNNPEVVSSEYIESRQSEWFIRLSFREEIRELMALADIVVLPSFYGEGVPQVLLVALAMGKPIVTTDNVGCRETVEHGKNGYIVPSKDSVSLSAAIQRLIEDKDKRNVFGLAGLRKVRREFDERIVIRRMMEEVFQIYNPVIKYGQDYV